MMGMLGTPRAESEDQLRLRFQVELEFVQCLANPNYLNFLAQREHFKDTNFINYLRYLLYWKEPEYARFLKYPMSLTFLDLLQYPQFRKELMNNKCAKFIDDQQLLHWQHYIRKRSKLVAGSGGQNQNQSQGQGGSSSGGTGTNTSHNSNDGQQGGQNSTSSNNKDASSVQQNSSNNTNQNQQHQQQSSSSNLNNKN